MTQRHMPGLFDRRHTSVQRLLSAGSAATSAARSMSMKWNLSG